MLRLYNISKTYEGTPLLRDISLTINDGEIVCLLGPSGSGKTTLLRIIAGLEAAEAGDVFWDQQNLRNVPVHQRGFGLMFQDLALFPHKNVFENVAFGLRMQNQSRDEIRTRVAETLELVGLAGLAERDVNRLSGGEQQRVALARSLAPRPKFLMFDEPLGALDRILREQLIVDVRTILKRVQMTALYVTHDQDEAFAIADRIAIIHDGRLVQSGAPAEIYHAPVNAFVARFLGLTNLLRAQLRPDARAETELGIFPAITPAPIHTSPAVALIRPDQIHLNHGGNGIHARVKECVYHRGGYRVRVETTTGIELQIESDQQLEAGTPIGLDIDHVEIIDA